MSYNISFEIGAVIIILMATVARKLSFDKENKILWQYRKVLFLTIVSCAAGLTTACFGLDLLLVPDVVLNITKTVYFILALYTLYSEIEVIALETGFKYENLKLINFCIIAVVSAGLVINIGVKFAFTYENHVLLRTPLAGILYIVFMVQFAEMIGIMIAMRNGARRRVAVTSIVLHFIPVICLIIQMLWPQLLMTDFGVVIAVLAFGFVLGEQDYSTLKNNLKEAELSKAAAGANRENVEAISRAKKMLIESTSTELAGPVEDIIRLSEELINENPEEQTIDCAMQIKQAGEELRRFLAEGEQGINEVY